MAQIVILLQLVLALLSNPITANDPTVQSLATQAIATATQAIGQRQSVQNDVVAGITKAPTGMEYDGNGNLVIIGSEAENLGTGAANPSNIATPTIVTTKLSDSDIVRNYNAQYLALQQQIIDIQKQYQDTLVQIQNTPEPGSLKDGQLAKAYSDEQQKIQAIQLQEQQLYQNYLSSSAVSSRELSVPQTCALNPRCNP